MQAAPSSDVEFDRALAHEQGPALVLGPTGSGRSELIARRLVRLVGSGLPVERVAVLTNSPAARAHIRDRAAELLDTAYEELWIETWSGFAERLLHDYALEAGIDPFFEVAASADRLAILLERVDELPLRRHEIRGNAAGLLARLLERIDVLKTEGIGPAELRDHARATERGASGRRHRTAGSRWSMARSSAARDQSCRDTPASDSSAFTSAWLPSEPIPWRCNVR